MQRSIILALLLGSPVGAFGNECAAGTKHKAKLTGLTCNTDRTNAASCGECCETDDKTCGGLNVNCDGDHYSSSTDAWKATAATEKTKLTACCTAKAKCAGGGYTCPAGKKRVVPATGTCTSDVASCGAAGSVCCVADDTTCGGATVFPATCSGSNPPPTMESKNDDGWKATKITFGENPDTRTKREDGYRDSCCFAKPKCASKLYTCAAGTKPPTTPIPDTLCTTLDPSSCRTPCCVNDPDVCAGVTGGVVCASNRYYDKSLASIKTTKTESSTKCCAAKATCANAKCPAGYMRKANTDKTLCSGNADSCTKDATSRDACCEKNPSTCGGLSNIVCPTGFFNANEGTDAWKHIKDETKRKAAADAWANKNATDATKNVACCTAKAPCIHYVGTSTPAATAATTTPAAPALKFSEHKVAVQDSERPLGMNVLWLAVGGFIGMGVLMAVQGLRSRAATTDADPREVNHLLDNGSLE